MKTFTCILTAEKSNLLEDNENFVSPPNPRGWTENIQAEDEFDAQSKAVSIFSATYQEMRESKSAPPVAPDWFICDNPK